MNRSSLFRPARLLCAAGIAVALAACSGPQDTNAASQASSITQAAPAPALSLIPLPASVVPGEGRFALSAATPLLAQGDDARTVAGQFAALLAKGMAVEPQLTEGADAKGAITFVID